MPNINTENWRVECQPAGQHGYVFYHEGSHELPFYWEYGGGDVAVIVRFDEPAKFALRHPWAAQRRQEILERLAEGLIRHQARGCQADIDEQNLCIYLKKHASL